MRYLLLTIALLGALLLPVISFSSQASATNAFGTFCGSGGGSGTDVCQSTKSTGNPIVNVLKAAIETIAFITGGLAIIFIVISAIKFVTSGGGPEGVASARLTLTYALVGVAVSALAGSIVVFVLNNV